MSTTAAAIGETAAFYVPRDAAPPSPLELATGGASTRVAEAFGALVWLANAGARVRSASALLPTTGEPLAVCDVSAGFYGDDLWKPEG